MNEHESNEVRRAVLEQIRSGKLHMRPRLFFILKAALVAVVIGLILVITAFLAGFVLFGLRVNGHDSLLGFGPRGIGVFLEVFPWPFALVDVAFVVALEWLLRRFRFAYRRSLVYLFIVIVAGAGALGFLFDQETGFNDDRFQEIRQGTAGGPLRLLYSRAYTQDSERFGIYRGTVESVQERSFVMSHDDYDDDEDDGTWTVIPPVAFDPDVLQAGDRVYVAGDEEGDRIEAYGIQVLSR